MMNGFAAEVGAPLQTLMFLFAGGFGAGCLIHAFAAREPGHRIDHLQLSAICLLACGYLAIEACGSHVTELAALASFRKGQIVLSCTFMMVYARFVTRSTGAGPRWMPWVFTFAAAVFIILDLRSEAGLRLAQVTRTEPVELPWGETIQLARGPKAATVVPYMGVWMALALHGMWCAQRARRAPSTIGWKALMAANVLFFVFLANDTLLEFHRIRSVYLTSLSLPVLAGAVWWRLAVESSRRVDSYRDLYQRAGDAILVQDAATGGMIDVNEAACVLFGRARDELLGRPLSSLMASSTGPGELSCAIDEARARGQRVVEHDFTRPDGSTFPAELSMRVVRIEGQERVITSLRDLGERRRVERELVENELRLRTVVERSPIPIAEASLDGRVHRFNPRFIEIYGFAADEGSSFGQWARLMHPDPAQQERLERDWRASIAEAERNGGVIPSLRMTFQDKRRRLHHADMCGVVVGKRMFLFFMELTEILEARDELARQEALLRAAIESATDGICVISFLLGARPRVALWNQRMADITGFTQVEVEAHGWAPGGRDAAETRERFDLIVSGHPLRDEPWEVARPDGGVRSCTVSTSGLPAPADERRVLVTLRDITAIRHAEDERRVLDAKVEHAQKLESLGVLAGGIAHDFNNILMSILGRTDLIRLTLAGGHAAQDHLREVKLAARRAADLCQQMLAYAGKAEVQVGPVDLRRLVDDLTSMLEVSISKRITMRSQYGTGVPSIMADAGQLQQVVMNLITNAADAIDGKAGTITRTVGVTVRATAQTTEAGQELLPGAYVFLEITDTGCGMDAYTRSRIFDPFFTTKFTGRGLGMAAVLGIMRAHRGGIELDSEVGRGTTVRVLFPAGPPSLPDATPPAALSLAPRQGTVLVVDDEASIRALTADMLAFLGYDALQAASGTEAIALFKASRGGITTVILDLTMPDLNGDETFKELRLIDPGIRVILSSGYSRHELARLIETAGLAAFLQKPFDVTALAEVMKQGDQNPV